MKTQQLDIGTVLLRFRAIIALLLLVVIFAALSPEFLTSSNLTILIKHVAINAILAVGMTFVILTAGIDLSVGSIAGVTGIIAGLLIHQGIILEPLGIIVFLDAWVVVVISLIAAVLFGALNGLLIAKFRVPPFVATLGTLYVARGAALLLSNGATFPNLEGKAALGNQGFQIIGGSSLLGLPMPIWIMALVALIAWVVADKTPFGRRVYAVGSNERAAKLAGVKVGAVQMKVYLISGFCAGIVGLIIASQLGAAHPATGETFELNAIAAVVLGGASLMGGRGHIVGTLIGAMVIGVLANGLVLLGVSEFWQMVIKGAVIVGAVMVDQASSGRNE